MSLSKDFLDQVADYLQNEGIGYFIEVPGHPVDIFVGKQYDDPANSVSIIGLPGATPTNNTVAELEFPRFQVLIRNEDYGTGSDKLRAIRNALHDQLALSFPNYFCYHIMAEQEGGPIGDDEKRRPEFSINFTARTRYADSI